MDRPTTPIHPETRSLMEPKSKNHKWTSKCENVPWFGDRMQVFSVVECVMVHTGSPEVFTRTRAGHGQRHHLLANLPLHKSIKTLTILSL